MYLCVLGISLIYTSLRLLILILPPLLTCSRARFQSFPQLFLIYSFFFLNICLGAARFAFPLRAPNAFNFDEELSGGAARKSRKLSAQKHYGNGTQRVSEARSTSSWRSCCCFVFLEIRPKSWGEWAETLVAQRTLPCCRLFGNTSECCPSH